MRRDFGLANVGWEKNPCWRGVSVDSSGRIRISDAWNGYLAEGQARRAREISNLELETLSRRLESWVCKRMRNEGFWQALFLQSRGRGIDAQQDPHHICIRSKAHALHLTSGE